MQVTTARDAKNRFGQLLDDARVEPVAIEKHGRPVAVLMSLEEFERLEALEDAWWAEQAAKAEQGGTIGTEGSDQLLRDLLNAEG